MHIRHLTISGFRAIKSQAFDFTDGLGNIRPITVLAAPNGAGKTSVLYAIVQSLRGAMGARIPDVPDPSEDDVHRSDPTGRRSVFAQVDLDIAFGRHEMDAIERVFRDTAESRVQEGKPPINPPALRGNGLKVHWQYPPPLRRDGTSEAASYLKANPIAGTVWLAGAKYAWRGWKSRSLKVPEDVYQVGMLRFFAQNRDIRWGLTKTTDSATDDPSVMSEVTVVEALRRLGEFAHGQGAQREDDRSKWEKTLQERFTRICAPKEYKGYWLDHPRYGETPLLEENGREYPFRSAASGEHVILDYLVQFTFPRPVNNSLILIDEPELHLHPYWIRQLYDALPLMGNNNQFILTTHSPELRQLAAEDNALLDLGSLGSVSEGVHA
ncbi:MAG: AAA family ATPase [Planctomycetes bacterium]|nr:AAA family ATPase [Planctomycetota bacterium]MDA8379205.1 AAA family ATPase [Planctomycetia bacterium]